jgi:hypothetical protein
MKKQVVTNASKNQKQKLGDWALRTHIGGPLLRARSSLTPVRGATPVNDCAENSKRGHVDETHHSDADHERREPSPGV